jgi:hypothetical protein
MCREKLNRGAINGKREKVQGSMKVMVDSFFGLLRFAFGLHSSIGGLIWGNFPNSPSQLFRSLEK